MNNSKLIIDFSPFKEPEKVDNIPLLRAREELIIRIITALQGVQSTQDWSTLKTEIFDSLVSSLTKELQEEAKKENPDTHKLNRLTGQLKWAERYSDLSKVEGIFRVELTNVRTMLYGNKE